MNATAPALKAILAPVAGISSPDVTVTDCREILFITSTPRCCVERAKGRIFGEYPRKAPTLSQRKNTRRPGIDNNFIVAIPFRVSSDVKRIDEDTFSRCSKSKTDKKKKKQEKEQEPLHTVP